jgi:L-fuculose-phosphate aldolase
MSLSWQPELDTEPIRREIVEVMRAMSARALNRGTAGNVSVRLGAGLLITPTDIEAKRLDPRDIVPRGR